MVFNKAFNVIAFNLRCDVESNEFNNKKKVYVAFLPSLQWTMICQALSSLIYGPLVV